MKLKQQLSLSTVAFMMLFENTLNANAIKQSNQSIKIDANIKAMYLSQSNDDKSKNTNSAIGGSLGIGYNINDNIKLYTKAYTTNRLQSKNPNGTGTGLFDADDDSYSIIGEANINIKYANSTLEMGRLRVDTPYINDDDIRMIPNLFEAVVFSNNSYQNITFQGGYISRWSGVDTPNPSKYEDLVDGKSIKYLSTIYDVNQNIQTSLWYFDIPKTATIVYSENSISIDNMSLGVQLSNLSEKSNSGVDGNVVGLSGEISMDKITLNLALNQTFNDDDKSVTNGFGGGAYYTSMDEITIDGLTDVLAYTVGAGYKATDKLQISYLYGNFKENDSSSNSNLDKYEESDVVLEYSYNDKLDINLIYTDVKHTLNHAKQDDSFDRTQVYVDYDF